MRKGTLTLLLVTAGALGLQAASAQEQYTLTYRFAKDHPYRFRDTTTVTSSQEMMGQEMKVASTVVITSRMIPAEAKADGSTVVTVSADGVMMKIKSPMQDTTLTLSNAVGKRTRLTLSKLGETLAREVVDTVKVTGMSMAAGRQDMLRLHVFPDHPVKVGEKWKTVKPDTTDMGGGGKMVTVSNGESTLMGKEPHAGHECLKISYTGTLTLTGKWSMNGMEFFLEGGGKTSGTYLVDPATGLPVIEDSRYDVESTVAITGQQNMTVPSSQSAVTHRMLLED